MGRTPPGADAVLVSGASVDVHSPKVVRSTAGSLFHLPVVTGLDVAATLAAAARRTASARWPPTVRARTLLPDADLSGRTAGSWATRPGGSTSEVRDACDDVVRVPIHGRAESLNLAMAATRLPVRVGGPARTEARPPGSVRAMPQPFRVPDDLAAHGLEFIPDGLVAAVGADATVALHELARRADHRPAPRPTSSAATSARRCPCRTSTGPSWWELTDPWQGLRHPHRAPRAAARAALGPRGARHGEVRPRRDRGAGARRRARPARRRGPPPGRGRERRPAHHRRPRAAVPAHRGQGLLARPCCATGTGSPTTRSASCSRRSRPTPTGSPG